MRYGRSAVASPFLAHVPGTFSMRAAVNVFGSTFTRPPNFQPRHSARMSRSGSGSYAGGFVGCGTISGNSRCTPFPLRMRSGRRQPPL